MSPDLFDNVDDEPSKPAVRAVACPRCRQPMRRIMGKLGPFWGCSAYPACEGRLYDIDGKPSETPDERYRCPVCTRPLARASADANSTSGDYWYCLGYNKGCKVRLADDNGRPARAWRCPDCGHLLKQRKSRNGVFWGCSQYPLCQARFPDREGRPRFPEPGKTRQRGKPRP
jgi:ssDNA-binding Zn-finger/Zn-ribbon topoisomerase 1